MVKLESSRNRRLIHAIALLALLLAGFTLRVWNVNFDQGLSTHPDERSTTCFIAPSIGWPSTLEEFGDPDRSPLNPLWNRVEQRPTNYTYGHFPLYMGILAGKLLHALSPLAAQIGLSENSVALMARAEQPCGGIAIPGRLLIGVLDTLTILLLYLLGRRTFGVGAGLLAAAFYAFAAQAVQLAHFFAMDPASTTFTVLAVLGGVKMVQERTLRAAALTGVAGGLAVASKFSALPVMAVPITAVVLWIVSAPQVAPRDVARTQARALVAIVVAFVVMALTFFVASPYAVLDWERFAKATLVDQGQMVRGVADMPFTRQYRNTMPYVYFIQQQVQWGLGWPLGILSLLGTLVAAGALVRTLVRLAMAWGRGQLAELRLNRVEIANVVIWSWVLPYFGITGAFLAKFNRYMSPVLPFAVLFGAGLLWLLWRWRMEKRGEFGVSRLAGRAMQIAGAAIGVVVVACALFWSLAYVNGVHGREHTWITASRWIYEHAPRGSTILWELWDDRLPIAVPNEPGMDLGSMGLNTIDWSPYEEDTAEKYLILKQKLTEADYVVYSSKRIYDSVDELPERYPMTTLYYDAMWDGRLGFELVGDFTSPPRLMGWVFEDRSADESWSLYDHPQVTVFRKARQLSDAEFDALFEGTWERAIPYYRGADSPISPLLELMGLGSQPGSERRGLLGGLIGALSGAGHDAAPTARQNRNDLLLDVPLANLPVVDNYRWNEWASEQPWAAVVVWWLVVGLLGWAAWPICFALFAPWLDRGYLFSRSVGWLLAGWLLWVFASAGLLYNTVVNSWLAAGVLVIVGAALAWRQRSALREFLAARWQLLVVEELIFAAAFGFFIFLRMVNPDIWQPWFGGEKFMEFAFLNGVLRSPTFPPVDPHFAGGFINYYYFGIYLVGYLIKLTGIYAEVAFNLTIPLLFALTVVNAFALAHTAWSVWRTSVAWQHGVMTALLGPFLVALLGNLEGYGQIVRQLSERSLLHMQSVLPGVTWLVGSIGGLVQIALGRASLPAYDFWGPSRVIPATINEFPYWSFLFADLHPHLIGIPLSIIFVGALFALLAQYGDIWRGARGQGGALLGLLAFLLGALISVNLWELPTYLGLSILTLLIGEYRHFGRIHFVRVGLVTVALLLGAVFFYLPFFTNFVNVGASGIGLVREGDDLGLWLLVWGGLGFIVVSWLLWTARNGGRPLASLTAVRLQTQVSVAEADVATELAVERVALSAGPGAESGAEMLADDARPEEATQSIDAISIEPEPAQAEIVELPAADEDSTVAALDEGEAELTEPIAARPSAPRPGSSRQSGVARLLGTALRHFDRLPRVWYLHGLLVRQPTLGYLFSAAAVPALILIGIAAWVFGRSVLGLCLVVLAFGLPLLWRREREADSADHLATMLAVTGVAILAGTQVIYLKDFLQGGDWYRMNTLFKFFNQVWVLWALAAAITLPRLWEAAWRRRPQVPLVMAGSDLAEYAEVGGFADDDEPVAQPLAGLGNMMRPRRGWGLLWRVVCVALLAACSAYIVFGTPARLTQRFVGWVPPIGTLNGMAFMQQGRYSWPNESNTINLGYDYDAITWLLAHVRGNVVIAESAEVDYYRAGGTRVASMTGLSGLRGAHVSEQRYGEQVGVRDGLHREFWATTNVDRTTELIQQLQIALIYVGQLERLQHPEGVQKLANMASEGRLDVIYENEGVTIYAVPGRVTLTEGGWYVPVPLPLPLPLPSMGAQPLAPVIIPEPS